MIDLERLGSEITASGKSMKHLAAVMGLSRQGLKNKLTGKSDFKTEEVNVLCAELGLTKAAQRNAIFFAKKVDKLSTSE